MRFLQKSRNGSWELQRYTRTASLPFQQLVTPLQPDGDRAVHDLGLFTVNLRGSGGGRILRMEVSLETTPTGLVTVQKREAQLRDTVITLVSDYDYADLESKWARKA